MNELQAVLMSIQPYWVYLIIAHKIGIDIPQVKSLELRKSFPQDNDWDRNIVIYCSKNMKSFNRIPLEHRDIMRKYLGKVIGEFVCDEIIVDERGENCDIFCKDGCLTLDELKAYSPRGILYGWYISDLVIYDSPKELWEFHKPCIDKYCYCYGCEYGCITYPGWVETAEDLEGCCYEETCLNVVRKPPQSWCYVKKLKK